MSPVSRLRHGVVVAFATAVLLAGLLPTTVLAVGPTAVDDEYTIPVNSNGSWTVMDNDIGTGLDLLETLTTPAHGTAFVNGTHVHYNPDNGFHGTDTFDYTIDDGAATDVGTVTVIVNTPPVAVDDPGSACFTPVDAFGGGFPVPEDYRRADVPPNYFVQFGHCGLLYNDTDVDGDALTYEILTQPAHGEAVKIDENFFAYKPNPDYGTLAGWLPGQTWQFDTFTYRAFDGLSYSDPATMSFWVSEVNDPPTFTPGPAIVTVAEDSGAYSAAWATDVSPGPASESAQTVQFLPDGPNPVSQPGIPNMFAEMPAINSDGVLTFKLLPDRFGLATVTFVAKDDGGLEDYGLTPGEMVPPDDTTDAFSFQIAVMPDAIQAVDDEVSVPEDAGDWLVDVLSNDTHDAGSSITGVTQGALGAVAIASGGQAVIYTPNPNATGDDSFTYTLNDGLGAEETATVTVHITAENDPPTAVDDAVSVDPDSGANAIDVLSNDTDVDGPALTIVGATDGAKGTVAITGGGTGLTYTPGAGETGSDTFTYTISDGTLTDVADVAITIDFVNDAPAGADNTVTTTEDLAYTFTVADFGFSDASDIPANHLLGVKITTLRSAGTLRNNSIAVTPGQVVSKADLDASKLTFSPAANGNGTGYASITFQVQDDGGTANGGVDLDQSPNTMTIDVTAVNDAPNAVNDAGVTVPEGAGPTAVAVLANDVDPDGDTMTITVKTNGTHGAVAITGGGTGLTYDPVSHYHGTDVFTYTVNDGHGKTDTATVLVTIPKDTTKPVVIAPAQRFPGQTVATTTTKVRLSWSGSDPGSGIVKYQLQASVNGGTFANVTLASATSTTIDRTLTTGATYRFRVRATDFEGNTSGYQYGPTFRVVRFQEASSTLAYTGTWSTTTSTSMLGGHGKATTSTTRRALFSNAASDFAWIATRTATSGSAQVWVDGVLATTVNLHSTSTSYRQLVFSRHFASVGPHTVEIRPMGGGRVDIDAFMVLR